MIPRAALREKECVEMRAQLKPLILPIRVRPKRKRLKIVPKQGSEYPGNG